MKTAYLFPGQGSQTPGMGKDVYEASEAARKLFAEADEVLGFPISDIMFQGTAEELTRTSVTQPAIYIHSVVLALLTDVRGKAQMVAGHSLGEFSALAASGCLSFADGLRLVQQRADAMQRACDEQPSTMAAIIGMEDAAVEQLCADTPGIVVPANYNSPGQLVISGEVAAIEAAVALAKERGARMAKVLQVNGAFHSPLMASAQAALAKAIETTRFSAPACPVYQNVTAAPSADPAVIRQNLNAQLTAPVRWTQSVQRMAADGATHFVEVGPGKVLQGLAKRIVETAEASGYSSLPA
ncbi:MAG: ACP S-malonyltransferase [Bacteroidetes bacterium]|nr:ACP S-malonyltransferase [Bacteroidota bacterium]